MQKLGTLLRWLVSICPFFFSLSWFCFIICSVTYICYNNNAFVFELFFFFRGLFCCKYGVECWFVWMSGMSSAFRSGSACLPFVFMQGNRLGWSAFEIGFQLRLSCFPPLFILQYLFLVFSLSLLPSLPSFPPGDIVSSSSSSNVEISISSHGWQSV